MFKGMETTSYHICKGKPFIVFTIHRYKAPNTKEKTTRQLAYSITPSNFQIFAIQNEENNYNQYKNKKIYLTCLGFLLFFDRTGSACEQPDAFRLNLLKHFPPNFTLWPTHIFEFFKEEEMFTTRFLVKLQFTASLHPKSFLPKFT